jgi:hypothetical protein
MLTASMPAALADITLVDDLLPGNCQIIYVELLAMAGVSVGCDTPSMLCCIVRG